MNPAVSFRVIGLPAPQGSKTRMPNGFMVEAGRKKLEPWRTAVANAAREQQEQHGTIDEPVTVRVTFTMPPTKSDPHRYRHTTKPDLDKLVRALLDSLVHAQLLRDDSLAFRIHATKTYATSDGFIGATVDIIGEGDAEAEYRAESKAEAIAARKAARAAKPQEVA